MCSIPGKRPAAPAAPRRPGRPGQPGGPGGPGGPGDLDEPGSLDDPGVRGDLDRPGDLYRLGRAIDELADAAQARGTGVQDVTARLARVWEMVAELDPELARRLAGYGS